MREIALDTETTGLDPHSGHRIVEIGCVEMINHMRTGQHFHVYLNPEREMPKEAERIHGLSKGFLADKPLFKSVADAFLEFIGDAPLVIHNAQFDMKFINAELDWQSYSTIPMSRTIDTVAMARAKFPGAKASLDALCARFNIDLSQRKKHGALLDAELLAEVYLELKGGRQSVLSLDQVNKQELKKESLETQKRAASNMVMRAFPPTDEELKAHARMLESIKDTMWNKEKALV